MIEAMKKPAAIPVTILIVALVLVAAVISSLFFVYPNQFRLPSSVQVLFALNSSSYSAGQESDLRILVGVLTLPDNYERRHILRHAYALQRPDLPASARVDVRFVFCNLTTEEQQVLVAMEIMLHDDIIILDCAENMNGGKTFTYFSSLPRLLDGPDGCRAAGDLCFPYDYVMKTDDDTYVRLGNLASSLRTMPREDVYYGFLTPCNRRDSQFYFMSGMGYVLSWDLVQWIATSEIAAAHKSGPEDIVTGRWLKDGGRGRNRYDMNPSMYDYPGLPPVCYRHELVPDTIAVHKLKTNLKWARTIKYFNVTRELKPSKLYHIP